jgi:hypothetical protein
MKAAGQIWPVIRRRKVSDRSSHCPAPTRRRRPAGANQVDHPDRGKPWQQFHKFRSGRFLLRRPDNSSTGHRRAFGRRRRTRSAGLFRVCLCAADRHVRQGARRAATGEADRSDHERRSQFQPMHGFAEESETVYADRRRRSGAHLFQHVDRARHPSAGTHDRIVSGVPIRCDGRRFRRNPPASGRLGLARRGKLGEPWPSRRKSPVTRASPTQSAVADAAGFASSPAQAFNLFVLLQQRYAPIPTILPIPTWKFSARYLIQDWRSRLLIPIC